MSKTPPQEKPCCSKSDVQSAFRPSANWGPWTPESPRPEPRKASQISAASRGSRKRVLAAPRPRTRAGGRRRKSRGHPKDLQAASHRADSDRTTHCNQDDVSPNCRVATAISTEAPIVRNVVVKSLHCEIQCSIKLVLPCKIQATNLIECGVSVFQRDSLLDSS